MRTILLIGVISAAVLIFGFKASEIKLTKDKFPTDLRDCLVKYKSDWGIPVPGCDNYKDSYVVYLRNTCDLNIDVKIAVQNKNKTYQILEKLNMAPQDTIVGYSCNGTGKFLKWVKKAGDREITFPTNYEIGKMYSK